MMHYDMNVHKVSWCLNFDFESFQKHYVGKCELKKITYFILFSTFAKLRIFCTLRYPKVHTFCTYRAHKLAALAFTFCHKLYIHSISTANRCKWSRSAVSYAIREVRVSNPRYNQRVRFTRLTLKKYKNIN